MSIEDEIEKHETNQNILWEGICGCGVPEAALVLMRDMLAAIASGFSQDQAGAIKTMLGPSDGGVYWWYFYFLDHLDLTEHGGSASACWLTDKGKAALEYLNRYGTDTEEWPEYGQELVDGKWVPFLTTDAERLVEP